MTLMNEKLSITNFNRACILDIALKSRGQKNMGASVVLLGNSPSLANNKKKSEIGIHNSQPLKPTGLFCHFRFQLEKMSVQDVQCFGPFVRG